MVSNKNALSVGTLDSDIPFIPPLFVATMIALGLILHFGLKKTPFLPKVFKNIYFRASFFIAVAAFARYLVTTCDEIMIEHGSGVFFTDVQGIVTDQWPFNLSRNPLYCGLCFLVIPATAIAFDSVFVLLAIVPTWLYFSCIVIPREEALLMAYFPKQFENYMISTPRWLLKW
jgi:protein-S-isoprenylcysteine O-methyltransferase Ste14